MLEALYKYAEDNELVVKPGFKHKKVKYYISFSADGKFIGFEPVEEDAPLPLCPDIGSLANGKTKSNIIVEKAEVVLNLPEKKKDGSLEYKREQKQNFYLEALKEAGEHDILFKTAYQGFKQNIDKIITGFEKLKKVKSSDFISIKVNGKALEESKGYLEWWEDFRKKLDDKKKTIVSGRCFITGMITEPVKTVPPVQGLISVGGHTKGDSFICFDKDAYQSYELKQAANAAVSEEAVTAVNAALTDLMKKAPRPLAGAKHIHWFSEDTVYDVTELPDYGFGGDDTDPEDDKNEKRTEDEARIRKMFDALKNNVLPEMPKNRYYMMSLSGVNGRAMIRSYDEGTYDELCGNLRTWYDDLSIYEEGYGYRYPKLNGIYTRLVKYNPNRTKKELNEKINEELSGLSTRIIYSIYHGTPLPDPVAIKALSYIRSQMYSSGDENKNLIPDRTACQILKAWLNRKYRKEKKEEYIIMDKLNNESPSVAYQAGRLMAVYAAIQETAMPEGVKSGVVERYYTAACSSPALVMGKLATMSQYHLSKIKSEKPGLYIHYSKLLEEITVKIGTSLPKMLDLEKQSEFALGYYFQRSVKYSSKKTEE